MNIKIVHKLVSFVLLILIFSILLCGCVDKTELSQIALVMGIGIDKIDDNVLVTLEIINPSPSTSSEGESSNLGNSIIETSTGKTVYDAVESFSRKNSVIMDFSHINVIIMSKKLCETGVTDVLDYVTRNHEFRFTNWILVANGAAQDVIKSKISNEGITSLGLANMMNKLEKDTYIIPVNVNKFVLSLEAQSKSAYAPMVELEQSVQNSNSKIKIEKTAIFKDRKLVGELSYKESEKLMWLHRKKMGDELVFPIKSTASDKNITVQIHNKSTNITPIINKDGISFKIECYGTAEIKEAGSIKLSINEVEKIEHNTEEILKNQMNELIDKCQNDLNTDIIGFSETIYNNSPKAWLKIKNQWNEIFPTVKYETNFKIDVNIFGMIKDSPFISSQEENK